MEHYFGAYQTFQTRSKDEAARLMSADNLIGDLYDIQLELNDGVHKARLVNRFNQRTGSFDPDFSRKLSLLNANGLTLKASLSLVGYTESSSDTENSASRRDAPTSTGGHAEGNAEGTKAVGYWGEAAVFGFREVDREHFERFMENISEKLKDGVRPRIDFGREGFERIVNSKGTWVPEQSEPKPDKERGTVIIKDHLSLNEKVIEQGRKGNKGCYLISWMFIAGLAIILFLIIKSLL